MKRAILQIEDETRDLADRAQLITALLAEGKPAAVAELFRILGSESHALDLREMVVTAALLDSRFRLLPDILDLIEADPAGEFAGRARGSFSRRESPALIRKLAEITEDGSLSDERRILASKLLGETGAKGAISELIRIWSASGGGLAEAARSALFEVIPIRFRGPAEAREWWAKWKDRSLVEILRETLRQVQGVEQSGVQKRRTIELGKKALPHLPLEMVISEYLRCPDTWELRRLGAERIGTYPYEEREGAPARKLGAAALVESLRGEAVPEVEIAIIQSIRTSIASVKEADPELLVLKLLDARLDGEKTEVKTASVAAIGDLKDPRALPLLQSRYNSLATGNNTELRLAILNAIQRVGNGGGPWAGDVGLWAHGWLQAGEPDERIVVRLIRLLQKSKYLESIETLVEFLRDRERSEGIRREAARALGVIGVREGKVEAVEALAEHGLSDPDEDVRKFSAEGLGETREVSEKVLALIRAALGASEKDVSVKEAVARSLLKLEGANAIPHLPKDADFWKEPLDNYLTADVIGGRNSGEAVRLIAALRRAGVHDKSVAAARLVLQAADLKWEGENAFGKGEIGLCLAGSLEALDESEEALQVLQAVPAVLPSDPQGVARGLLMARLYRRTKSPEKVEAVLKPILELADPPVGAVSQATLEIARAHLMLGKFEAVRAALSPLLGDPKYGEAAREIDAKADEGIKARTGRILRYIAGLDAEDEGRRGEAVQALKGLIPQANIALGKWLDSKPPAGLPAAVKTIGEILGKPLEYDPDAPEADRKKILEEVHESLAG